MTNRTTRSAASAEHRLVLLTATRWLPVGITLGLTVLLPLERGFSIVEVGMLIAVGGFVVLGLELPTGGLADTVGRRPVLVAAGVFAISSALLVVVAHELWTFLVAAVLQGIFRALDSGPLEAWYVDAAHDADPAASVARGLSRASAVLGVVIGLGALAGGALVAWHPVTAMSALAFPFLVAAALYAVHTALVATLVTPPKPVDRAHLRRRGLRSARDVAAAIAAGIRLVRSSTVLRCLILVEVFWSIAMVAFETLTPVRLSGILGGEDAAGALFGPAATAAWGSFAVGSWLAGLASRRIGIVWTAILCRVLNGLFVVGMGLAAGVAGVLAGFWLAYLTHGAAGPMHNALLHRQASSTNRAAVLSLNSMVAGGTMSVGALALTSMAGATNPSVALVAAGAFSILGALLYLPALRQGREDQRALVGAARATG